MRLISNHLGRTSLVNKRFIIWHKGHWKKWSLYLFIFEHWKGNQLYAKVMARAPISWLDKRRKCNHLIGYISNSNFKFSNSKPPPCLHITLCFYFCVCWFFCKRLILNSSTFLFSLFFILIDAFGFPVFWFHEDREITRNLFTVAENNFSERKRSWTHLNFGKIYLWKRNGQSWAGSMAPSCPLG